MYADQYFLLLALGFVAAFAVKAWRDGVVGMLWGVAGAAGGIVGGYLLHRHFIAATPVGFRAGLALAFCGGLVIYLATRFLAKAVLKRLFEIEGPLHFLADGFGGMALSLIPSLLTLTVVAAALRVGGTVADLRRYELLSTPGREFLAGSYPARPLAAKWRDSLESLPGAATALALAEPLGRVPERSLVTLLVTSKKPPLFRHLSEHPESGPVIASDSFAALLENPGIQDLNARGERLALLRHPAVRAAALDPTLRPLLAGLELDRLVDGFLLSEEWQEVLKSYQRDRGDLADPDAVP